MLNLYNVPIVLVVISKDVTSDLFVTEFAILYLTNPKVELVAPLYEVPVFEIVIVPVVPLPLV